MITGLAGIALGAGALFSIMATGPLQAPDFQVDENGLIGVSGDVHCNRLQQT